MLALISLKDVWDALTALGTVAMAVATFIVVLQGWRLRRDDHLRHQDEFRPICVLTPFDGVDPRHRRDELLTILEPSVPGFGTIEIKCMLRNIGSGPAINVAIKFRFQDMAGYTTDPWELSPLAAGESRGGKDNPLDVPVQFRNHFNSADFAQVPGKAWELILVYDDVFGNNFYSVHRKRPLQLDQSYREASTSELVAPMQPWVTLGKGKPPSS
ncbi:MAG: hypothetical protein HYX37_17405 [Rhizobiales bacterium]|nr:hypothetical protein [Hyphomicrobiales bacterium]